MTPRRGSGDRPRDHPGNTGLTPAQRIDARIEELGDWRGELLARLRRIVQDADPQVVEEWKWRGVPVWEHDGILCTGEIYRNHVKLTFHNGAALADPSQLFNSSLAGNTRRAIDFSQGAPIDERALKALVRSAVSWNKARSDARAGKPRTSATKPGANPARKARAEPARTKVRLLAGGNPQIAKADGDAPVQAYIAALSGWQRERAQRVDAIVVKTLPDVRKAVKWNSPLYGVEGQGWFLGVHVFTRYLKLAFFRGASLRPVPPGTSKDEHTRYLDLHEDHDLDEQQLARWVKQAAALPGWVTNKR
ncbi:MAG: DUF1801 domain-containing protein [Planctomycetes bacterium]|nr:DUF1801 domain-containing protein [Planctomycetota bacterium]